MGLEFLKKIFGAGSQELFIALIFGAIFVSFTVCLFLSVFKTEYGLSKRAWYLILAALFCAVLRLRAEILAETDYSSVAMIFALVLFLPVYFIRRKKAKEKCENDARREFVKFIDGKMRGSGDFRRESPIARETEKITASPVNAITPESPKKETTGGIDFSHVKSVLKRLEPAALSYADRKQIHDLEVSLFAAERGETSAEIKSKINEGLGNLLKIMAKHGI